MFCCHLAVAVFCIFFNYFCAENTACTVDTFLFHDQAKEESALLFNQNHANRLKLARYLHLEQIDLIICGNGNRIDAECGQWRDNVNLLCLCPGVVIAYNRDFVTNEVIRSLGIMGLESPGAERSRGRGGSHRMKIALIREVK